MHSSAYTLYCIYSPIKLRLMILKILRLYNLYVKGLGALMFFMSNSLLFSQELTFYSGIVIDGDSKQFLENVTLEVNGESYSVSKLARFNISVQPYDTLIFSHIGYVPFEVLMPDSIIVKELPRAINLFSEDITLKEVVVRPNILTEEMMQNAQHNVKMAVEQAMKTNGSYSNSNAFANQEFSPGVSSSQMVGFNVLEVANAISKKIKSKPVEELPCKVITYDAYCQSLDTIQAKDTLKSE